MGRSRIIKGDTFRSRSLAKCSPLARLTFIGLWTECDDAGRGIADPRVLCGALWSLDEEVTPAVVEAHLQELASTEHIVLYAVADDTFFAVRNWEKHQAAAYRKGAPKYPDPDDESVSTILHADACKKVLEVKGSEMKGREGKAGGQLVLAALPTEPVSAASDFDQFWDAYPNKQKKTTARAAFDKAMRRTDLGTVLAALEPLQRQAKERPGEIGFIPHPTTWLNQDRWTDVAPVQSWQEKARANREGRTWDSWSQTWVSNFMVGQS